MIFCKKIIKWKLSSNKMGWPMTSEVEAWNAKMKKNSHEQNVLKGCSPMCLYWITIFCKDWIFVDSV